MTLTVVSHDAGGAQVLSHYLAQTRQDAFLVLAGPAEKVFFEAVGRPPDASDIGDLPSATSHILTGTSWKSDLEWRAIWFARERNIFSSTYLDHWVNYRDRFRRNGIEVLPDQILVGDEYALDLARGEFPVTPVLCVPNPYLLRAREIGRRASSAAVARPQEQRVLYAAEIDENQESNEQVDALAFFLRRIEVLGLRNPAVTIRPHPTAPKETFRDLLQEFPFVALGGGLPLFDEIGAHDVIVSRNSMALIVGAEMGKRAISAIPPGSGPCLLPGDMVEDFRDLIPLEAVRAK